MKIDSVLSFTLSKEEIDGIVKQARLATIGGESSIRLADDRKKKLIQDQVVGMAGHYALCKYWFGDDHMFRVQRFFANQYPNMGDGGVDIPGSNVDIKTSHLHTSLPIIEHCLPVRPREFKESTVYILGLFEVSDDIYKVHLVGWAKGCELSLASAGVFTGAYTIKASGLHELPPIMWWRN